MSPVHVVVPVHLHCVTLNQQGVPGTLTPASKVILFAVVSEALLKQEGRA